MGRGRERRRGRRTENADMPTECTKTWVVMWPCGDVLKSDAWPEASRYFKM